MLQRWWQGYLVCRCQGPPCHLCRVRRCRCYLLAEGWRLRKRKQMCWGALALLTRLGYRWWRRAAARRAETCFRILAASVLQPEQYWIVRFGGSTAMAAPPRLATRFFHAPRHQAMRRAVSTCRLRYADCTRPLKSIACMTAGRFQLSSWLGHKFCGGFGTIKADQT